MSRWIDELKFAHGLLNRTTAVLCILDQELDLDDKAEYEF